MNPNRFAPKPIQQSCKKSRHRPDRVECSKSLGQITTSVALLHRIPVCERDKYCVRGFAVAPWSCATAPRNFTPQYEVKRAAQKEPRPRTANFFRGALKSLKWFLSYRQLLMRTHFNHAFYCSSLHAEAQQSFCSRRQYSAGRVEEPLNKLFFRKVQGRKEMGRGGAVISKNQESAKKTVFDLKKCPPPPPALSVPSVLLPLKFILGALRRRINQKKTGH